MIYAILFSIAFGAGFCLLIIYINKTIEKL